MKKLMVVIALVLTPVALGDVMDAEPGFIIDISNGVDLIVRNVADYDLFFDGFVVSGPSGTFRVPLPGYKPLMEPQIFDPYPALEWTDSLFSVASLGGIFSLQPGQQVAFRNVMATGDATGVTARAADVGNIMGHGELYSGLVVPEPASMSLLAMGALALTLRRRNGYSVS